MKLCSALIALPLLSLPALAGGLDRNQVDSRAKWIAHVDLEAFKSTQLFREIQAEDKNGDIERGLAELARTQGVRLFDDVFSVTAYGTSKDGDSAVVLVQASAHIDAALQKWQSEAGAKPVKLGERDCIEWGGGHGGGFSWINDAGSERRQIVLAKTAAGLQQALEVLERKRTALGADAAVELALAPTAGSFAFVAVSGILDELGNLGRRGPENLSAAARLAKGMRLELGENAGTLYLDVRLRAEKPEDALRLKKVFDGLLALPGLMQNSTETSEIIDRLVQAISTETLGETMHMRFQYGAHAFFDELRRVRAIQQEDQGGATPEPSPAKKPEPKPEPR